MPELMSAAEAFQAANALFVDEDYEGALQKYTDAIELDNKVADYYVKRAATYIKLGNFTDAIEDTNAALKLEPNNATAYLRQGIAYFELEEYESAKSALEKGQRINPSDSQFQKWLRKCNAELENEKQGSAASKPTPPSTEAKPQAQTENQQQQRTTPQQAAAPVPSTQPKKEARYRHEWYQSPNYVNVSVFAKGIKKEQLEVEIEPKSLSITIKIDANNDYTLSLDLFDEVIPSESKYELLSTKIEVKLKKKNAINWDALEATEAPAHQFSSKSDVDFESNDPKNYPSSSKKKKNWDLLDKEAEKEEDKPEGEAALNKLFQQIYANADDDTRRAMIKSFTESGGTVLSTNWKEVGAKKVEGSPPEHMEMKKWEK
eukprot:GEZU01009674.1.p1 GENE.GEZU01009674.1~~GEZU01009674.1.p1  ORF type:complete len:382 (-),score=124.08 GEZU01009674.1:58-1182(-)